MSDQPVHNTSTRQQFHKNVRLTTVTAPLLAAYQTKERPRSWLTDAAQIDEMSFNLIFFPVRNDHLRTQVQWLHVDLEHQVKLLFWYGMRRRGIMDHAGTVDNSTELPKVRNGGVLDLLP